MFVFKVKWRNAIKKKHVGEKQENFSFCCWMQALVFYWEVCSSGNLGLNFLPLLHTLAFYSYLTIKFKTGTSHHLNYSLSKTRKPDILEREAKWALRSIAVNKANRADGNSAWAT